MRSRNICRRPFSSSKGTRHVACGTNVHAPPLPRRAPAEAVATPRSYGRAMTDDFAMATGEHGRTRYLVHEGVGWSVYERTWGEYDRRSATKLVFESDGVI